VVRELAVADVVISPDRRSDALSFAAMAGGIGPEVLPLLEDVSFAVNERERLRRDDLSRSDSTL
jgi:hypothetical protein